MSDRTMIGDALSPVSILALLLFSPVADAQISSPEQSLDAVCKSAPMPVGFVPVGEMESPECKESAPGKKNAWLIDAVRDKIVSCTLPDYATGYPPSIAYVGCERVQAGRCPPIIDGTPNGFRLMAGASCRSSRVKSACLNWEIEQNYVIPNEEQRPKVFRDSEPEFFKLNVVRNDMTCVGAPGSTGNDRVFYITNLLKGESLPLCAAFNNNQGPARDLETRIQIRHLSDFNIKVAVVRQFNTDLCPPFVKYGQLQSLNAFVVQRLAKEDWMNKDVFMCSSSLKKKPQPVEPTRPGNEQTTIVNEANAHDYEEGSSRYTVKRVLQDDRCGVGSDANAYMVRFHE